MTAAVKAMIFDWGVPWMNLRHIRVSAWSENIASVRVFEKNGFKLINTVEDSMTVRGRLRSLHVMEQWL
jgi:RimJ/RimL family protein N-acetyltransferase